MSKAPTLGAPEQITIFEDEVFKVTAEEAGGNIFLHCEVREWNKTQWKRAVSIFSEIKEAFYLNGLDEIFTYCTRQPAKWVKKLGEYEVIDRFDYLGEEYEVIKWDLR